MLEEFLGDIGIYEPGQSIADAGLLDRFSDWCKAQVVNDDDFAYFAARVAAFICEYVIERHAAERYVAERRILLRLPIDVSRGVYRELDPYSVAVDLIRERQDLKDFLNLLCGRQNA